MIHVENDDVCMEGSPLRLLGEAAVALTSAAHGFFEVSKEIEDTEEKAKKTTEDMLDALFTRIREAAFDEIKGSCSTFEIKRRECKEESCEEEEKSGVQEL